MDGRVDRFLRLHTRYVNAIILQRIEEKVFVPISLSLLSWWVNPLSPNSDQQQFSPNDINSLSRDKVMRINKMIIIEKIPLSFIKFCQLILKGDVWRSVWRICMWILGLKGLNSVNICSEIVVVHRK